MPGIGSHWPALPSRRVALILHPKTVILCLVCWFVDGAHVFLQPHGFLVPQADLELALS